MNDDTAEPLPLPPKMQAKVSPDMVVMHDFGDGNGLRPAITLRNWMIAQGITESMMREMDDERAAGGLPPMFCDEAMDLDT